MPASWAHQRAKHIRKKNPDLPEGAEYGIATLQGYATKKNPKKDFGTAKAKRKAKKLYKKPASEYEKKANPKKKKSSLLIELVALANRLDEMGFSKYADSIDAFNWGMKPGEVKEDEMFITPGGMGEAFSDTLPDWEGIAPNSWPIDSLGKVEFLNDPVLVIDRVVKESPDLVPAEILEKLEPSIAKACQGKDTEGVKSILENRVSQLRGVLDKLFKVYIDETVGEKRMEVLRKNNEQYKKLLQVMEGVLAVIKSLD